MFNVERNTMTLKQLRLQILVKFIFAALFLYFAFENVATDGWGVFAAISALFATNNIVQGIRLIDTYNKIKDKLE